MLLNQYLMRRVLKIIDFYGQHRIQLHISVFLESETSEREPYNVIFFLSVLPCTEETIPTLKSYNALLVLRLRDLVFGNASSCIHSEGMNSAST